MRHRYIIVGIDEHGKSLLRGGSDIFERAVGIAEELLEEGLITYYEILDCNSQYTTKATGGEIENEN